MTNKMDTEIQIVPELHQVLRANGSFVESSINALWGAHGSENRTVRFTPSGMSRMSQIFGTITAFHIVGRTDIANRLAQDLFRVMNRACVFEASPEPLPYHGKVPMRIVELSDDGGYHSFSALWYRFEGPNALLSSEFGKQSRQDSVERAYPLTYRMSMNGAIIQHGLRTIEDLDKYAASTEAYSAWSIHT